jgi:hypothetical protein
MFVMQKSFSYASLETELVIDIEVAIFAVAVATIVEAVAVAVTVAVNVTDFLARGPNIGIFTRKTSSHGTK